MKAEEFSISNKVIWLCFEAEEANLTPIEIDILYLSRIHTHIFTNKTHA